MFPGDLCRLRGGWVAAEGEREQEGAGVLGVRGWSWGLRSLNGG